MEIAVVVIPLIALLFALFLYFKHDLKIKRQELLLSKYQLDKIEKEKENEKKAVIEANVVKGFNGNRIVKIYNKGKCTAQNVNVVFPEKTEGYIILVNPCPIEIKPQHGIEILLGRFTLNYPNTEKIYFEWSDDFKLKNISSQTIQIS